MARYLDEGAEYDRDFPTHDRGREAYRFLLLGLRGDWEAAAAVAIRLAVRRNWSTPG